ncbi:MAG: helicase C-terminal domain-containing protein [Candidatus Thermoplasmatota archaeon]|nr:helicase C-terminal domain-containing protein [Candidatus Thermoplasmatota archaeon]
MRKLIFPYHIRAEQQELIDFVSSHIDKPLCINATTGFGKTPCILSALLPFRKRIIWAVRTGNESDRPIEELKVINNFFGLSYRGKKDMCLLKEGLDYDTASYFCKKKMKDCVFNKNLSDFSFSPEEPLLYSELLKIAKKEKICPYYFQRKLLPYASVIGLSYNYILSTAGYSLRSSFSFPDSFLVVDEAHNLEQAAINLSSVSLRKGGVEHAIDEIEGMDDEDGEAALKALLEVMERIEGESRVDMEGFLNALNLRGLASRFMEYGEKIRAEKLERNVAPRSSLYHLGSFLQSVEEKASAEGVVMIASDESFEIYDMRARELLSELWDQFLGCVFCSGTLEPVEGFAETIGLRDYEGKSFYMPFKKENVKGYIIEGLSTEGEALSKTMANRYVEAVSWFLNQGKKSALFCSSYRIMGDLLDAGLNADNIFIEKRSMSGAEAKLMLERFREAERGCLVASAQGRFAEGIDLPQALDSVFIAGIPFERATLKTTLYIKYYMNLYGAKRGRYYAYTVPAIRRVSQAMGRALRGLDDKAFIVCGDERYAKPHIFSLLPYYFRAGARVIRYPQDVEDSL